MSSSISLPSSSLPRFFLLCVRVFFSGSNFFTVTDCYLLWASWLKCLRILGIGFCIPLPFGVFVDRWTGMIAHYDLLQPTMHRRWSGLFDLVFCWFFWLCTDSVCPWKLPWTWFVYHIRLWCDTSLSDRTKSVNLLRSRQPQQIPKRLKWVPIKSRLTDNEHLTPHRTDWQHQHHSNRIVQHHWATALKNSWLMANNHHRNAEIHI